MNYISFLFLVVAIFCIVHSKEIDFEPCGGEVKSVNVDPCVTEPCEVPKGSSAFISVHCVSNVKTEKLQLNVYAEIVGVELPYPGMKRDACKGKNLTCPITENQDLYYTQNFAVKKFFPNVETKAKFVLKSNDNQDKEICCFKAPVKVVNAKD